MLDHLGRGRKEGAERDIIGPRLARLHREVAAGVAGYADLRIGAEHTPRLLRIAVALHPLDPVGADPLRQRHIVVYDEGGVVRGDDRRSDQRGGGNEVVRRLRSRWWP